MIERPSARLILLDPQDRLFLFKVHDPGVYDPANPHFDPFWVMIGGFVDPGEEFADAAVREAYEETRLPVIGPPRWVWSRERRMSWRGKEVLHKERFFLARTDRTDVDPSGLDERDSPLDVACAGPAPAGLVRRILLECRAHARLGVARRALRAEHAGARFGEEDPLRYLLAFDEAHTTTRDHAVRPAEERLAVRADLRSEARVEAARFGRPLFLRADDGDEIVGARVVGVRGDGQIADRGIPRGFGRDARLGVLGARELSVEHEGLTDACDREEDRLREAATRLAAEVRHVRRADGRRLFAGDGREERRDREQPGEEEHLRTHDPRVAFLVRTGRSFRRSSRAFSRHTIDFFPPIGARTRKTRRRCPTCLFLRSPCSA